MMLFRKFFSGSLRAHATLISFGLIALTALLGFRAYSVGRAHFLESKDLLEREAPVQMLIFQIETTKANLEQARKKYRITHDPVYAHLFAKDVKTLAQSKVELDRIWPELAPDGNFEHLRERIAAQREQRVRHARDTAEGLLRLIVIALSLSVCMTAWFTLLLYKGLVDPIEALNQATKRIRSGDFSFRVDYRGVTELQDLAVSFNSMAERLESLDQAEQNFLAMISHEIKNPIAALKEGLNLLASPEKSLAVDVQKRCTSACLIASKRLEYMINNLLSLSRSEGGMFNYEFSRHNFETVVQSSVAEVRPIAEKKGIQFRVLCPDNLVFAFNLEGMVQAFVNLLLNAIKYGSENSTIDVVVRRADDPEQSVRISISNSGKEIAPAELTKIFDQFYRGKNSGKQQGMGIGLHVVKRVVEAHRGLVSALSESGRTEMVVKLPLMDSSVL